MTLDHSMLKCSFRFIDAFGHLYEIQFNRMFASTLTRVEVARDTCTHKHTYIHFKWENEIFLRLLKLSIYVCECVRVSVYVLSAWGLHRDTMFPLQHFSISGSIFCWCFFFGVIWFSNFPSGKKDVSIYSMYISETHALYAFTLTQSVYRSCHIHIPC